MFSVAQEKNLGVSLAAQQGYDRIQPADHITAQEDRHRPKKHDARTTFTVHDPADEENEGGEDTGSAESEE